MAVFVNRTVRDPSLEIAYRSPPRSTTIAAVVDADNPRSADRETAQLSSTTRPTRRRADEAMFASPRMRPTVAKTTPQLKTLSDRGSPTAPTAAVDHVSSGRADASGRV